jgi:alpha-L-rhamnosidase
MGLVVVGMRTNNQVDPIGLDDPSPRLSWEVVGSSGQAAYQIRAAESVEAVRGGQLMASTTMVGSTRQSQIEIGDLKLGSRQTVTWQVRVWDERGNVSAWSTPATWEMGLIGNAAWAARWIENPTYAYTRAGGEVTPLPVFGKGFSVDRPVWKARLYVTGLGMFAASVNGKPAGEAILEPGQTTYSEEVHYRTYDVTAALRQGSNVVGIETGSGTYQRVKTPGHYFFGADLEEYVVFGAPKVIAQLEISYADGSRQTIASDQTWKTALGATTYSSWWSGEEFDARRGATSPDSAAKLDGADWSQAALATLTDSTTPRASTPLVANPRPPVTVAQRVHPETITKHGDSWILDFGANRSGWPSVSLNVPRGTTVTMTPSEKLKADGSLGTESTGVADGATDAIAYKYTSAGGSNQVWHPQFTYSGFRYLRVDGLAKKPGRNTITMLVTHAALPTASTFRSSSAVLNAIHEMTLRSTESNMMSVLTDCPNREKGPYTGDNLHNIDALLSQFDMAAYQPQLVKNMASAQRDPDDEFPGLIANIAPEFHRVRPVKLKYPQGVIEFLDEVNWGSAVIRIPWKLYTTYGDTRTMATHYDTMVKWLDYEAKNRADNNGDIPGLGDWSAAESSTPMQLAIYAGYFSSADEMSKIAGVLGKHADEATYRALADELATTFTAGFRHTAADGSVYYGSDSETSNAMALDAGLVSDADRDDVVAHLIAAVRTSGNHITTGSVGLGPLFRALQAAGRDDVIYDMVTNTTAPGYGYLVARDHTTLSEDFSGGGSQNHHFLGQVDNWLVSGVVGIQQAAGAVGYRELIIKPAIVGDLTAATGSYETPYGPVSSSWSRPRPGHVTITVSIPSGTSATILLPNGGGSITSSDVTVTKEDGAASCRVGAGNHAFDITP